MFPKELQKILAKIFYGSETSDKELNLSKITDYESPGKLMAMHIKSVLENIILPEGCAWNVE